MPADTRKNKAQDVDPVILAAIRQVVREELQEIEKAIKDLAEVNARLQVVEDSLTYTGDRLETAITKLLPAITEYMGKVNEALAMRKLESDVHNRKWNVVIHGIQGQAGEPEHVTRATCRKFASEVLKVKGAESTRLAACHRLSQKPNAGIIIRFSDLADRDAWLAGTANLRGRADKVSLSIDLPPVVRPLKDGLLKIRKDLPPDVKGRARLKHIPVWPFVELHVPGQPTHRPVDNPAAIAEKLLGINPYWKLSRELKELLAAPARDQ